MAKKPRKKQREKVPAEAPAEPIIVSEQKELARLLGVTPRTVRNWLQDPAHPDIARGYDVAAWREFQRRFEKGGSETAKEATRLGLDLKSQRVEQERLRTRQMELKLQEQERELLPRRAQELAIATILTNLGDKLDQLPDLIAGDSCPKCRPRIRSRLKAELDSARSELADSLSDLSSRSSAS